MNKKSFATTILIMMVLLTSCGSTDTNNKAVSGQVELATETPVKTEETKETEVPVETESNNDNMAKESAEKFLEEWFAMGTYEKAIAINGEERDEEKVTVQDDYCILPQCSIVTIMGGKMGSEWEYPNVSEEDARKIVNLLEKTKLEGYDACTDGEVEKEFPVGVRMSLVILNSRGEYSQVILHADRFDKIRIELRPEGVQKQMWFTAPNKELTDLMKKYMNYRLISDKDIENITEIEVFYKNGETNKLDKTEVEQAKKLLKTRERTYEARDYISYDVPVIARSSDGQEFNMKIYERQHEMIMEGGDYEVSEELLELLMNKDN